MISYFERDGHSPPYVIILHLNRHLENSINQTKHPRTITKTLDQSTQKWSYLKIPCISQILNSRVLYRSHTLRRALSHKITERTTALSPTPNCASQETLFIEKTRYHCN